MSLKGIPERVKMRLWGRAAGRCQYDGCNRSLWLDRLTKVEFNTAYIAHIIGEQENGPRGDTELSEKLRADISNLMLMCDEHHRLIDREDVEGHSVERLRAMKRSHEERIELLTGIHPDKKSEIILYGARIGEHHAPLSYERVVSAMVPERYPASSRPIAMSLKNSCFVDLEPDYWFIEGEHLQRQFDQQVKTRLAEGQVCHFSIFGIAPQPLLIKLGTLLSDIPSADVYQLHREPPDWKWQAHRAGFEYKIIESKNCYPTVGLNLSLSATISNERISEVLKGPHSVWTITIDQPDNDFLKSREQLEMFRSQLRKLLNQIKARHGEHATIHVFPAVPVSVAVELGRVWMPKADLPLAIYDQNRKCGGFVFALKIIKEMNNLGDQRC